MLGVALDTVYTFGWANTIWILTLQKGFLTSLVPQTNACHVIALSSDTTRMLVNWLLDSTPLDEIPLDIQALGIQGVSLDGLSAFQRNVLLTLREHAKRGSTLSYLELATRLGRPSAVRAVANALGKNRFALLFPCHRVLRRHGQLGGFAWGSELKAALLNAECVSSPY